MGQKAFNIIISIAVLAMGFILCLDCRKEKEEKPPEVRVDSFEYRQDFHSKSPEDGLMEALIYYEVQHPQIVYAQAVLETGHFKSDLCLNDNNLFGLYNSKKHRYYTFAHWKDCVIAYKVFIQRRYKPPENYYKFLQRIGYAGDPNYISKLKKVVNKNDTRRSE